MISVCQGKVGEGKSYHVLNRHVIPHLLSGGVVATNMSIDLQKIKKNYHRNIFPQQVFRISATDSPFDIPCGDFRGHGNRRVIVVLDEALNWFASSTSANDERKSTWGKWLRQTDKIGQDVIFIAQSFDRAAKWIRELSQVMISICNLKNVSFLKFPIGKWLHLDHVYAASYYDVRSAYLFRWGLHAITSKVYDCYNTSELYGFPASSNAYSGLSVAPAFTLPVWPFTLLIFWLLFSWFLV